jgi:hypothetical protein
MQNLPFAAQQEQVNKFLQANRVLGAQMDQMQGTTRVIYDTIAFPTGTNPSTDFFNEISGRSGTLIQNQPVTNLTDNRFEPGEGMVVKEIGLMNFDNGAAPITPAIFWSSIVGLGLINFYIGNNRVIKDLPILAGQSSTGINNINAPYDNALTTNNTMRRYLGIRLFTNIVIPPQVQFYANIKLPFGGGTVANTGLSALRMYVKGYGKLFNPRNNY